MKRILFFHEEFPCGGAERITIDIAHYLLKFDYEVFVAAYRKKSDVTGIQMLELPDEDKNSLANADALIRIIQSFSIDVFVLPIHPLKHVGYIMDHVSCKLVFVSHSIPMWEVVMKVFNKKHLAAGSWLKTAKWHLITYPRAKWFRKYDKPFVEEHCNVYHRADAYVVLCENYKNEFIKRLGLSGDNHKFHVIPNSERQVGMINHHKKKQVLFSGRLSYLDKRVDRLLDIWGLIFAQVPDWELLIVGDGAERKALEEQAERKKLPRVRFLGYQENMSHYYSEASVLCLTSTFEGWGLCLTEAQANGVVPIAYDCSAGVHEIISPSGTNGYLVPPFSQSKYAKTLLSLLKSPEKLKAMQENVVVKARDYSPEVVGQKWKSLFESL